MLGPIEKEEGEVVMVQAMVGPEPWLAAAVAAHFFFLGLYFLKMLYHILLVPAANLRAAAAAAGRLGVDWRV